MWPRNRKTEEIKMIRRTYACEDCEQVFTVECGPNDPDPSCPNPDCNKVLEWRPQSFAIGGSNVGKAAALTQKIMEEDYGLSNFRDNVKEGETAIVPHHETKAETELVNQTFSEMQQQTAGDPAKVQAFWGGNAGTPTSMQSMTGNSLIQMAKVGPQGHDPMAMLHAGVKGGRVPRPEHMMRKVAAVPMENPARKK